MQLDKDTQRPVSKRQRYHHLVYFHFWRTPPTDINRSGVTALAPITPRVSVSGEYDGLRKRTSARSKQALIAPRALFRSAMIGWPGLCTNILCGCTGWCTFILIPLPSVDGRGKKDTHSTIVGATYPACAACPLFHHHKSINPPSGPGYRTTDLLLVIGDAIALELTARLGKQQEPRDSCICGG